MKRHLFLSVLLAFMSVSAWAAKTFYKPDSWTYNSSTKVYTESGVGTWSVKHSKETDNCILFWQDGFGDNPTSAPSLNGADMTFDPDAVLQVAETCYALNVNTLGFSCSNMLNKYKIIILMNYTDEWTCYGGGYDFECSALWLNPATVKPAGHSLAHEVGHSFHYMVYAAAANYSHTSSSSINTGFHLSCGSGQAIWEQTAQWQANQAYPNLMFSESYPLFGNNANYAFSHEFMRYQSYWFHYYLSDKYNDKTIISQIWKQPMTGQSNGNATDFCQALIALKGLSASDFYSMYFDYAMKCATYDFSEAASYRDAYVGNFDYYCSKLGDKQYQVAYASAPQSTGFNVIELTVPTSGTTITTAFKALTHGCALAEADPAQYNDGNANSLVKANVTKYNSAGTASYRGFRVGYVFLKSDGTRTYYNDNTVHCTGTAETTESISTTVPANTSRIFLVVAPALTTYVKHAWDDNVLNDDQWPYSFTLTNTDLKSASVFTEPIPDEPTFTKVIDGRSIADVTLTYNVILPPSDGYDAATITLNSGNAVNVLCTAFQLESNNIFGHVIDRVSSQSNGTIMSCAVNASGNLLATAHNTGNSFGHWFNSSGSVVSWGTSCVAFTEFDADYATATVGQYPNANSNGTTRTIREALVYKDNSGKTARATFVYNITFKTGAAPTGYLSAIDYTEPTIEDVTATAYSATSVTVDAIEIYQGETGEKALTTSTVASALNNLTASYLTSSTYFKGYSDPLSSASAGNYVYYYALDGVPTTATNGLKYFKVAPVTTDEDFNGQYVYYYDDNGQFTDNVSKARIKVAYDRASAKFSVKATANCPLGTYTVYMGMVRRVRSGSTRNYVAYFPLTINVTSRPGESGETLDVERYPGQGYGTTEASVDFTAAMEFLGVSELTTDMLRVVNPDGTQISAYANYDGWFDGTGTATTWGDNTKINVKFFQAVEGGGTYTICDMNSADVVGTTYTVKWALVSGNKTYTYTINVKFVEKPAAELYYDDLTVLDTQEVSVESQVGQSYEGLTASVNMSSILTALGVSSLNDLTVYAVQSDGSLDDNYKLGGTDGWRDAEGNFQTWGDNAYYCMKVDFALAENQFTYIAGMMGKNTEEEATYTSRFAFVDANKNAVILNASLVYKLVPLYLSDFTVVKSYDLPVSAVGVDNTFATNAVALDVADVATALGLDSLDNTVKFYALKNDTLMATSYTANLGYYVDKSGYACAYSSDDCRFFVEYSLADGERDFSQLNVGQKPGVCQEDSTYQTKLYICNPEASKLVQLNIAFTILPIPLSNYTVVGNYDFEVTVDSLIADYAAEKVELDVTAIATALGLDTLDNARVKMYALRDAATVTKSYTANNGYFVNKDGYVCAWATDETCLFIEQTLTEGETPVPTFDKLAIGQYPDGCEEGATYHVTLYIGDPETMKLVQLNFTYTIQGANPGDVNKDGTVSIADVTALVNIVLGKDSGETPIYDHKAADVNKDGSITIADVTALVNIVLGKN